MGRMLRVGSLFAGIGGLELGLEMTGHFKTVWQVEKDEYAAKVLAKHWPKVKRHDDVCTFPTNDHDWQCDVICGGFPCQDISYAGDGAGLDGKRSGLFYELARVVSQVGPKYVVLENVAALLTRGMGDVLGTMATLGYDCQWHCIPAASVGAPHIRDRVFILCHANQHSQSISTQHDKKTQGMSEDLADADCKRQSKQRMYGRRICEEKSQKRKTDEFVNSSQGNENHWHTEPNVGRVVDGVPSRMDRLRCLGNAVVPQVAQFVGEILWSIHNGKHEPQQGQAWRA